jgi:hypothetical protein
VGKWLIGVDCSLFFREKAGEELKKESLND